MKPAPQLGDSHNFGRRVELRAGRIHKPRTVLWEWLTLSPTSPLRRLLDEQAKRDGMNPDVFSFIPALDFISTKRTTTSNSTSNSTSSTTTHLTGDVKPLRLSPLPTRTLPQRDKRALAVIVGRSLALWSWLGVADLHWENLALGIDSRDRIVFGPLDVEMILADLSLPTETKLLPDADPEYAAICRHACGVRRVLPYLGKPIDAADLLAMAGSYLATLAFLDRHAPAIAAVLSHLPGLRETPIRVCLRGTDEYVQARSEPVWPPLLDAEAEQLARGDIPYFFRQYGRPGIHYYRNRALTQVERLPLRGDVPQLDPMLSLARGLRAPSRKRLRQEGLFMLLGAFDHASLTGRHKSDQLEVALRARSIVAKWPNGEELRSARNLSAHVGSVYLPCRCGEVRSVFVPPVTVCKPSVRGRG